ncbi:MAG: gamma-glutamyl-gamma-aminobutyrate hydrolase family protein, partial [Ruminococcus flavefaciens]
LLALCSSVSPLLLLLAISKTSSVVLFLLYTTSEVYTNFGIESVLLLDHIIELDKPILGICRGIQLINAALGGTLWQDIPSQFSDMVPHCQKPPYDVSIHEVSIEHSSPLYDLLKTDTIPVNSYHHQGIRSLSPELKSMAYAPDGLVEAVCAPGHRFLWAIQWHPELSYRKDINSRLIFKEFVRHC